MNLTYKEEGHEYQLDGRVIPSVSQIAQAVTGKNYAGVPAQVLKAAQDRGKAIHADVESGIYATPEGSWIGAQINRADYTFEQMGFAEIAGLMVAGRYDLKSPDGIDDIKTQENEDRLDWTIKLNLYRKIFGGDRLRVFHTPKSGGCKVVEIEVLSDEKIQDIIDAYREGRTLDMAWLKPPVVHEEVNLDVVIFEHDPGSLSTNVDTLIVAVNRALESYKAENYSENDLPEIKRDRAKLNKTEDALKAVKRTIAEKHMAPIQSDLAKIDEVARKVKESSGKLDDIAKTVEGRAKEERQERLKAYFASLKCEYVVYEKIHRPEWLNKTFKENDAKGEILKATEKIEADLAILDRIGEPEAKAHYLLTLNLESALAKADEIKQTAERLKKIEEARNNVAVSVSMPIGEAFKAFQPSPASAVAMVERALPATCVAASESPVVEQAPEPANAAPVAVAEAPVLIRIIEVHATGEQLQALAQFMNATGIKFRQL